MHLEEESGGRVVLRRLEKSGQQFQRCRRAVVENLRKDFFTNPHARYKGTACANCCSRRRVATSRHPLLWRVARCAGLTVTDVFKIEHKLMLHKFLKLTAGADPGKVKGLFCSLPPGCVPRVVTFGAWVVVPALCCGQTACFVCACVCCFFLLLWFRFTMVSSPRWQACKARSRRPSTPATCSVAPPLPLRC